VLGRNLSYRASFSGQTKTHRISSTPSSLASHCKKVSITCLRNGRKTFCSAGEIGKRGPSGPVVSKGTSASCVKPSVAGQVKPPPRLALTLRWWQPAQVWVWARAMMLSGVSVEPEPSFAWIVALKLGELAKAGAYSIALGGPPGPPSMLSPSSN
jgi:hypothetical protein